MRLGNTAEISSKGEKRIFLLTAVTIKTIFLKNSITGVWYLKINRFKLNSRVKRCWRPGVIQGLGFSKLEGTAQPSRLVPSPTTI